MTVENGKEKKVSAEKPKEVYNFNIKGFSYGLAANFCYAMMHLLVKVLYEHNKTISKYEVIYWRGFSMIPVNYMYIRQNGKSFGDVPKQYRHIIIIRTVIGFFGLQGNWGAYKYMPLNLATSIIMTSPIATLVLTRFMFKEQLTRYDVLSIITSFIGVLLIINPFKEQEAENEEGR